MHKIQFVCHGNICRSPMAEYLCKDLVKKAGREQEFFIVSTAVSAEELGNPVYPPVKALLKAQGIDCADKRARQLSKADGDKFDLFICMDDSNVARAKRIVGEANAHKCKKLLSFAGETADVADPWYTRDFEMAYADIKRGFDGLLKTL